MKKILLMLMLSVCALGMFAQNVSGESKFTDNWSVSLNGGVVTGFDDMFGHVSPIIVIDADKYVTPWLGFGIDARTAIAAPSGELNPHTAFDAVNVGGNIKVNLANLFAYNGTRRLFEPVVYAGLGWSHKTCSHAQYPWIDLNGTDWREGVPQERNYMTYRAGTELNFNLGKKRAWAIRVNPSVVWGNIRDMRLTKHHGNFEITAGLVYHFKTSNGTHSWTTYSPTVVRTPEKVREVVKEVVKEVEVVKESTKTILVDNFYRIGFEQNKSELTPEGLEILNRIPKGSTVKIYASASPEGTSKRNTTLVNDRAMAVATHLSTRGVRTIISNVEDARQAIVEIVK